LCHNSKKWFGGKHFSTNVAVEESVNGYFSGLERTYFSDGMKGIENRWTKCIEWREDNVEK